MRRNLLTNSSFVNGTSNWSGLNARGIQSSTDYKFLGSNSLLVTKQNADNAGVQSTDAPQVTPGLPYAGSAYVFLPPSLIGQTGVYAIKVYWLDALGNVMDLAGTAGAGVTVTSAMGWTRLSGIFYPPTGASRARFSIVQLYAGTDYRVFYADAALFEQSPYVNGYIDNFTFELQKKVVNKALTPLQARATENIQLNADVVLDTLILNTIDEYGVVWVCSDIDGWWGQSDPDMPKIERGVDDGSYDVAGRYQARTMTLTGSFLPPSPDALPAARDRLIAATNLVRRGAWLRTNESPTRAAFVRLNGRPKIETVNVRGRTDFSITLSSGDPIKYHWLDTDPNGYTTQRITANAGIGTLTNIGTSNVPVIFRMVGPMGAGTRITNPATNQVLTLTNPLRRATATARVINKEIYKGNIILTVDNFHDILVDDKIVVSGLGSPYDTGAGQSVTVVAQSSDPPYTISYGTNQANAAQTGAYGLVALAQDDVLEIDTYEKSVTFNGLSVGQRSRVGTLVDWISLAPGLNTISLDDAINPLLVSYKSLYNGDVTLTTEKPHYLINGEPISITLPTSADLALKALSNNYATLTTESDHGYSIGDKVIVSSISRSNIAYKSVTNSGSNATVTLNTVDPGAFAIGDVVNIALSTVANIAYKAFDGSNITLNTSGAHGFSNNDAITLSLATNASIAQRAIASNIVTIATTTNHNYSVGDTLTTALPLSTIVSSKILNANGTAILGTSSDHGFSNNDYVTVALPTTATLTGTISYSGNSGYLVTANTTSAHGFIAGDKITVDINNASAANLTTYNGTKVIETVPSSTSFTYLAYGPDAASSTSVGATASVIDTTNRRLNGTIQVTTASGTPRQFTYTMVGAA